MLRNSDTESCLHFTGLYVHFLALPLKIAWVGGGWRAWGWGDEGV